MFKKTTAQSKIASLRKRVRIVQGGTSASKTFSIIPLLITYAIQKPNILISIVAESVPHIKRGALRDFLKIMDLTGNFKRDQYNMTSLTYTFTNGSKIEFFGADQPDKLRGARRDVLFINEANNIAFDAYQQLSIRTNRFIYLDYNPTSEFWAHTELIGDKDTDFIILTYKDNEALEPAIIKEIEKAREKAKTSSYWENWWNVYGLGNIGSLEGVIYSNWSTIDSLPKEAELLGYGMDFGFSVDPTALIAVYRYNSEIIFHEVIHKKGLLNSEIIQLMKDKEVSQYSIIYGDSAEPKTIEEIRRSGFAIKPVTKGADSIRFGIQILQDYHFRVTKESTNLIKELRYYVWDTNKQGEELKKPIDAYNHCLDAARYFAMMKLNKTKQFWVV